MTDRTTKASNAAASRLRKSLVALRRVVLPMREVVNTLMRRDVGLVSEELLPYYQDVYDHVLRGDRMDRESLATS